MATVIQRQPSDHQSMADSATGSITSSHQIKATEPTGNDLLTNSTVLMLRFPSTSTRKSNSSSRKRRSQEINLPFVRLQQAVDDVLGTYERVFTQYNSVTWDQEFDEDDVKVMRWLVRFEEKWEKRASPTLLKRMSRQFNKDTEGRGSISHCAVADLQKHFRVADSSARKELEQQSSLPINHLAGLLRGWVHQVMDSWKSRLIESRMAPKGLSWHRQEEFEVAATNKILARVLDLSPDSGLTSRTSTSVECS